MLQSSLNISYTSMASIKYTNSCRQNHPAFETLHSKHPKNEQNKAQGKTLPQKHVH